MSTKPRKQPITMFGLGQRCCYWKSEGPYYCGEFGPGDEALLDAVDMAGNQGLRCCVPSNDGLEPDAATTARAAFAATKTTAPTTALQNVYFPKRTHRKLNEITLSRPTRYFRGGAFERVVEFETSLVDLRLGVAQTSESSVETVATVDDALAVKQPTTLTLSSFSESLGVVIDSPFDRITPLYPQPEAVWRVPSLRLDVYDADGRYIYSTGGFGVANSDYNWHFWRTFPDGGASVALPKLASAQVGTATATSPSGNVYVDRAITWSMTASFVRPDSPSVVADGTSGTDDGIAFDVRRELAVVATGSTQLAFPYASSSSYALSDVQLDAAAVAELVASARAFWACDVSPTFAAYFAAPTQAFAKLSGTFYRYPGVWTNDVWAPYPDDPIAAEVRSRWGGAGNGE
ncbi:MAG: hypothetical protein IJE97_14525 [Thermoguttaceae bacterium]|nr:hypothetical protein [Thermoguttaceae bacterium]